MIERDERGDPQLAGALLDTLGVTIDLEPNQQITEAMVIAKVVDFDDSTTGLVLGASQGLDWITQMGLLAAARHVIHQGEEDE